MFRSGFFNSNNHDKQYYASDISKLFDSLINPGVFGNVGNKFIVRPGTGMQVIVPSGLAWFNSTWTVNDADEIINLDEAPYVANYKRIDTIYLKVYPVNNVTVRDNTTYYAKGVETNGTPKASVPESTDGEIYIPLCYISIGSNATTITASMIRNCVGTSECPFITGILETINADELLAQWQSQWDSWLNTKNRNYEGWFSGKETDFAEWLSEKRTAFMDWFESLQAVLDGDVAGHLQNEIDAFEPVRKRTITNLLDPSKYVINSTLTTNGVTITPNSDGTFTVDGTTDSNVGSDGKIAVNITQWAANTKIATGYSKLKLCGTPSSINQTGMLQLADLNTNSGNATTWATDKGDGFVFNTVDDKVTTFALRFEFLPNATFDNVVFKPMLTGDLNATYDDYVEYSGNGELNENVADVAKQVIANKVDLGNKVKFNGKNVNISMELNGTSLIINTTNV